MPLQRRHVDFLLNGGRNSKVAEELIEGPQLVELKNVDNKEIGALNQREGYEQLTLTELGGGATPTSLTRLAKSGDSLLLVANDTLYRYVENDDRTVIQPAGLRWMYPANSTRKVLFDTQSGDHDFSDMTIAGNYLIGCFVGDNSAGSKKLHWFTADKSTYDIIAFGTFDIQTTNLIGAKLVTVGAYAIMVWRGTTSGHIRAVAMNTATTRSFGSESSIITDQSTSSYRFDIATDGTDFYVAYAGDEASLHVKKFETGLVQQAATSVANEQEDGAIGAMWSAQASSLFVVVYEATAGPSNVLNDHKFNAALTTHSTLVLDAVAGSPTNVTLCPGKSDEHVVFVQGNAKLEYHEVKDTLASKTTHEINTVLYLTHRAVRLDTNTIVLGVVHHTDVAETLGIYYTLRFDVNDIANDVEPIAKYATSQAGTRNQLNHVSNLVKDGDLYRWAGTFRTRFRTDDDFSLIARSAICEYTLDRTAAHLAHWTEFAGTTFFAGSVGLYYTGFDVPNLNFFRTVESVAMSAAVGSGSLVANTKYQYVFVYEEVDHAGVIHRSGVSIPKTVQPVGSENEVQISSSIRTPIVCNAKKVRIAIYRTEGDSAGPFYRVSDVDGEAGLNFLDGAFYASFTDGAADNTITDNELLYTTGGLLENHPPPPCRAITKHRNRVFAVDDESGDIWPSHQHEIGNGLAFNENLKISTAEHGKPVALRSLKTHMAVFWSDKVGILHGSGLDRLGRGAQYQLQVLPGAEGCSDQRSIVEIPTGIIYKSPRGWRLLTRDLQIQVIGQEVDDFDSETVVSADLVENVHEVRICLGDTGGTVLVYEYLQNTWQTYTGIIGGSDKIVDALTLGGRHVLIDDSDKLWKQTSTATKPSPTAITAHHKFAGLQGFQRVRRLWLYGNFDAASALSVKFYYDHSDTASFTRTATVNGTQYQIGMPRQKCEAVQLEISGFRRLVSYRFEYAVKRGGAKTVTQIVS